MKTYVAEINGEAILAFRAETDDDARQKMNGEIQRDRNGFAGLLRENGEVLWDGESEIETRLASDDEHGRWCQARDAESGGQQIDPITSDDRNAFIAYLISVRPVDVEPA